MEVKRNNIKFIILLIMFFFVSCYEETQTKLLYDFPSPIDKYINDSFSISQLKLIIIQPSSSTKGKDYYNFLYCKSKVNVNLSNFTNRFYKTESNFIPIIFQTDYDLGHINNDSLYVNEIYKLKISTILYDNWNDTFVILK